MEPIQGRHKAPKLIAPEEEDFITTMPDDVLTNILDRLSIQDAVRTCILARSCRYNWTTLSQLVFELNFFDYLSEKEGEKKDYWRIISGLLLHIKGTITKFSLCNKLNDENVSYLISSLSGKGIKDLTLVHHFGSTPFMVPTNLFSCLELKHLTLFNCCFNPPPTFHGFPNLLSLDLVLKPPCELGEFIARCPLLEKLSLRCLGKLGKLVDIAKLADIAKLKNLKVLCFSLFDINTTTVVSFCSIFELLLGSLPKLQHLYLNFSGNKLTAFLSLKALYLTGNGVNVSCAFELITSCPNLQTLVIFAIQKEADPIPIPIPEVEYNITGLERLELKNFIGSKNEMYVIKYLFACSPLLKKIVIRSHHSLAPDGRLIFARKLLKLRRASTLAKIDFC